MEIYGDDKAILHFSNIRDLAMVMGNTGRLTGCELRPKISLVWGRDNEERPIERWGRWTSKKTKKIQSGATRSDFKTQKGRRKGRLENRHKIIKNKRTRNAYMKLGQKQGDTNGATKARKWADATEKGRRKKGEDKEMDLD